MLPYREPDNFQILWPQFNDRWHNFLWRNKHQENTYVQTPVITLNLSFNIEFHGKERTFNGQKTTIMRTKCQFALKPIILKSKVNSQKTTKIGH
jgi:hypothetical protein